MLLMIILPVTILTVRNTRISFPVPVGWRVVHCSVVCQFMCSGVFCIVDLSCQIVLLHAGVTMVMID